MKKLIFTIMAAALSAAAIAQEEAPAFPGAEGHGRYVTGGRGGKVIHVTNLNDSGTGSLRAAVSGSAKKIIVFDVGGVIALKSNLSIGSNTTIAGQTAPAPGITLRYYTVRPDADNVIIRFIRIRRGQEKDVDDGADAIWTREHTGMILDHCSFSWSIDEVASFYDMNNYTMQWCTLGESLNNAGHGKGAHGYGGIWGGKLASFHHNLITHVNNRAPRFCGARYSWTGYKNNKLYSTYQWANHVQSEIVDFRNCVIYNWASTGCYGGPGGGYINIVNNYYKPGPSKPSSKNITQVSVGSNGNAEGRKEAWGMTSRYYINGNTMTSAGANAANYDWNGVSFDSGTFTIDGYVCSLDTFNYYGDAVPHYNNVNGKACVRIKLEEPTLAGEVTTHSAEKSLEKVLAYAGASLDRDDVDSRYATEVKNGTATYTGSVTKKAGIIDKVSDVNGYTEENFGTGGRPTGFDTDNDGMPDVWETANGLNPNDASDAALFTLDSQKQWYSNLEVYLNSLVEDIMKNGNSDAISAVNEYYPTCTKVDLPATGGGNNNPNPNPDQDPNPGETTDATVTWVFDSGSEGQTATYSSGAATLLDANKVTLGSNLAYNGVQKLTDFNETKIRANVPNESEATDANAVTFTFTTKSGTKFQAKKISFAATRLGTDGGKLDAAWVDAGGKTVLTTGQTPNRNNDANQPYTNYSFEEFNSTATEGDCSLVINIYALGQKKDDGSNNLKDYGLGNIAVSGKLSQTSSGISQTNNDVTVSRTYYNIKGQKLSVPDKGVNIVVEKMADGTTRNRKVIMK